MLRTLHGFTILETLVAVAIGGIAIAGVVSMIEQVGQSQSTQKYGYEANNLTEEMRTVLGSNAACYNSFKNVIPANIINTTVPYAGPIYNDANSPVYQVGSVYGDRAVKLASMELSNYGTSTSFGGVISLLLDFSSTASVNGGKFLRRTINLQLTTNTAGAITSCVSQGKATDGLWKITPGTNTNIYYAGGNVGIGVSSAVFPLQVAAGAGEPSNQIANFSANASYLMFGLNNSSAGPSQKSALLFEKNQAPRFELGTDISQNGGQNFYLWDYAATAARLFVDPRGYLGINTTAPAYPVDVVANSIVALRLNGTYGNGGSNNTQLRFAGGASGELWAIGSDVAQNNASRDFHFYALPAAGNRTVMTLKADTGFVGLGTLNPQTTLHISSATEGNILLGQGIDFQYDGGNDGYFVFNNYAGPNGKTSINGAGHQFLMMQNLDGKVGINSSTPQQQLDVNGDIGVNGVDALRRDGNNAYLFPWSTGYGNNNVLVGGGATTNLMVPTGFIGVGTTTARAGLDVYSTSVMFHHGVTANPVGYFAYGNLPSATTSTFDVQYNGGNDSEFYYAHNGLHSGSTNWVWQRANTGILNTLMVLDNSGNLSITGCASYAGGQAGNCASDSRLKKDVVPFTSGLDKVLGLNPVWFKYNGLGNIAADTQPRLGVIAQDVEKIAPELIGSRLAKLNKTDAEETEFRTVNYASFIYLVINAIKEFYALWKTDHAAIAQLQKENAALKAQLESQAHDLALIKQKLNLAQ